VRPDVCPNCQSKGPFTINATETVYQNYQKLTLQVGAKGLAGVGRCALSAWRLCAGGLAAVRWRPGGCALAAWRLRAQCVLGSSLVPTGLAPP